MSVQFWSRRSLNNFHCLFWFNTYVEKIQPLTLKRGTVTEQGKTEVLKAKGCYLLFLRIIAGHTCNSISVKKYNIWKLIISYYHYIIFFFFKFIFRNLKLSVTQTFFLYSLAVPVFESPLDTWIFQNKIVKVSKLIFENSALTKLFFLSEASIPSHCWRENNSRFLKNFRCWINLFYLFHKLIFILHCKKPQS